MIVDKKDSTLFSESVRVTSIKFIDRYYVIFIGVPLHPDSFRRNSGKYYVSVKSELAKLPLDSNSQNPLEPSVGQHWEVKGKRTIKKLEEGDYVMEQHEYDSPSSIMCKLPKTGESLINFIAAEKDFRGIGEVKARELWASLGDSIHSTLRNDNKNSRERLRGLLSKDSIDVLFQGYAKYKNLSHYNWMSEKSIPAKVQERLFKYHKEKSIDAIKDNPYLLSGFGMTFKEVDKLAQAKFKVKLSDQRRLSSALEMSIQKEVGKGHTYAKRVHVEAHLRTLLDNKELISLAFKAGYDKTQFILNKVTGSYHPTAQFLMESVVVKRLFLLAKQKNLYNDKAESAYCKAAEDLPFPLNKKQTEAILATLDNAVSCITGGAGTGKTTVLRTVLRAYSSLGFEIHAVALSGRAAQRLHESIGFETMTIARLLKNDSVIPSSEKERHLLVIDEASMVDLPTMYRIVTKLYPTVRIILTGDPDQLPPIGCGKVLADIVESKTIVNTMLDIVERQEGTTGIPEYSKQINQGVVPDQLSIGNIHFHETPKSEIASVCTDLYRQSVSNSRILAATKVMVADINKLTQQMHNPEGQVLRFEMHGEFFYQNLRLNDAILFTQNNYCKGIQNGSLGKLINVEPSSESYGIVKLDTGDKIEITQDVLDCMELGYCITLHKAQGSQFPRIIIALQKGHIVDRAWLYTAITRAENEIHIVGNSADFAEITVQSSNSNKRRSYLGTLLEHTIND